MLYLDPTVTSTAHSKQEAARSATCSLEYTVLAVDAMPGYDSGRRSQLIVFNAGTFLPHWKQETALLLDVGGAAACMVDQSPGRQFEIGSPSNDDLETSVRALVLFDISTGECRRRSVRSINGLLCTDRTE